MTHFEIGNAVTASSRGAAPCLRLRPTKRWRIENSSFWDYSQQPTRLAQDASLRRLSKRDQPVIRSRSSSPSPLECCSHLQRLLPEKRSLTLVESFACSPLREGLVGVPPMCANASAHLLPKSRRLRDVGEYFGVSQLRHQIAALARFAWHGEVAVC